MRAFLICALLIAVTSVASFTLGLRQRQPMPSVITTPETMIWHQECVQPEPGEELEKL